MARNTLSRWESGAFKPSGDGLDRLAEITAVDRTWLETRIEPDATGDLPASLTFRWTPGGIEVE